MTNNKIISMSRMISMYGESTVNNLLSSFSSPLNPNVESFIKFKAIEFAKQSLAQTRLVFAPYNGVNVICGYFTITLKVLLVDKKNVGSTLFKRLRKFGTYDEEYECCTIPVPLIAQLGKNFSNGYNELISGDELLNKALSKVKELQDIAGGKAVYIECEDREKLIEFYQRNGFKPFGKRVLDKNSDESSTGNYLIKMLKYL